MPTLKLKQLVDGVIKAGSKFTFPNEKAIEISGLTAGKWNAQYTAPAAGYVCLTAYKTSTVSLGGSGLLHTIAAASMPYCDVFCPVSKGASVRIYFESTATNIRAWFVPAAGSS